MFLWTCKTNKHMFVTRDSKQLSYKSFTDYSLIRHLCTEINSLLSLLLHMEADRSASLLAMLPGQGSWSGSSLDRPLSSSVSKDSIVSSRNMRQAFSSADRCSRLSSLCNTQKKGFHFDKPFTVRYSNSDINSQTSVEQLL